MENIKPKIQDLISQGKTKKAIQEFLNFAKAHDQALYNELITIQGKFKKGQRDNRMGVITGQEWNATLAQIASSLLELLEDVDEMDEVEDEQQNSPVSPQRGAGKPSGKKIFISYNHKDGETARKLKKALEQDGHQVTIDVESMPAGMDIRSFIDDAVEQTDVTLSLVSKNSLLSGWVAMETINTLNLSKFNQNKKFIACYLDDEFFKPEFRLEVTDVIDKQMTELNALMDKYREKNIEPTELYSQRERLSELRHNLGKILDKLRNSKALDMSEGQFEQNLPDLLKAIKS